MLRSANRFQIILRIEVTVKILNNYEWNMGWEGLLSCLSNDKGSFFISWEVTFYEIDDEVFRKTLDVCL